MKTKALVTMLLLLLYTMVFASEDAGDAAEHAQRGLQVRWDIVQEP